MSITIAANAYISLLTRDLKALNAIGVQVQESAWEAGPVGNVDATFVGGGGPIAITTEVTYANLGTLLGEAEKFKDGDNLKAMLWDPTGGIDDATKANRLKGWFIERLQGVLHDEVVQSLFAQAGPFYSIALRYYGAVARCGVTRQRLAMGNEVAATADGCAKAEWDIVAKPELGDLLIPTAWYGTRLGRALIAIDRLAADRQSTLPVVVDRPPNPDVVVQCDTGSSGSENGSGEGNGGVEDGYGFTAGGLTSGSSSGSSEN